MKIALTGDVMLGRLVDRYIVRDVSLPPVTIWWETLPVLLSADVRCVNLECVISRRGRPWEPQFKAFRFRAHPRAVEILQAAHIQCVTLANNHSLDYGAEALAECVALLDQAGIRHASAGLNLKEALKPALLDVAGQRLAVIGLTDNEPSWEAAEETPGVNYVSYDARGLLEPYRARMTEVIGRARRHAGFVIVSAHVGPNWGAPSPAMQALAHQLLDLGADLYWGHSNHTPQGIEIYRGKPILYSTGDFIDDYAVDPYERNDLSFLFILERECDQGTRLRLHPVAIENFRVRPAKGDEVTFLQDSIHAKCAALGTRIQFQDGRGVIAW